MPHVSYVAEDFLILVKTYPEPSRRYRETTCVAAMNRAGELRRLYPVPFRFLVGENQLQKWEWIRAPARRPNDDHRPEDLIFMMGTIHRFPDQWLIIGVIYPPKVEPAPQMSMDLG